VRLDERELDIRVSTVPNMFGESVVMRLLEQGGRPVTLDDLGMPDDVRVEIENLASRPHGMLLATGPTGSGKTTTLYACVQRRDVKAEKIITVEDPVEYQLADVTQVPVHREAGVTFASALRSILRQDPDVIMVGEMRDAETAEIAVQAAMTGHLVLSTLHTNDAVGAVARLLDLGVAPYLAAATLNAVIGQRLVRRICDGCRAEYQPTSDDMARAVAFSQSTSFGSKRLKLSRGVGCRACRGTGFKGRVGVFELMVVTDDLKDAMLRTPTRRQLITLAEQGGMRVLHADAWAKVERGVTTLDEVLRVAQN
jgi:general secretion pathway protein E